MKVEKEVEIVVEPKMDEEITIGSEDEDKAQLETDFNDEVLIEPELE